MTHDTDCHVGCSHPGCQSEGECWCKCPDCSNPSTNSHARIGVLGKCVPRFLFPEFLALVACGVGGLALFAFSLVTYGFARSWPVLGVPLGVSVGLASILKLGGMVVRGETELRSVNKGAMSIMVVSTVLMFACAFVSAPLVFFVVPSFLYGVWRL